MAESRLAAYLEIGRITSVHALKGEVKITPWCDSPEMLTEFKTLYADRNGEKKFVLRSARCHGGSVIAALGGIDTPEAAQGLVGKTLYAARTDMKLPEKSYFICDLIGCAVADIDSGENYGVIYDVLQTGANDVYCSKNETREFLFPAIADVVVKTDVENGIIHIRPLKGLFDND